MDFQKLINMANGWAKKAQDLQKRGDAQGAATAMHQCNEIRQHLEKSRQGKIQIFLNYFFSSSRFFSFFFFFLLIKLIFFLLLPFFLLPFFLFDITQSFLYNHSWVRRIVSR